MSCEASQLHDIEPPVSQVVTIETPTKRADICVSKTDHSNSLLKSISRRNRRQPYEVSSRWERSIQQRVDNLQRQCDLERSERINLEKTVLSQDRQLSEFRSMLGDLTGETGQFANVSEYSSIRRSPSPTQTGIVKVLY